LALARYSAESAACTRAMCSTGFKLPAPTDTSPTLIVTGIGPEVMLIGLSADHATQPFRADDQALRIAARKSAT